jgi:hypothetical protein
MFWRSKVSLPAGADGAPSIIALFVAARGEPPLDVTAIIDHAQAPLVHQILFRDRSVIVITIRRSVANLFPPTESRYRNAASKKSRLAMRLKKFLLKFAKPALSISTCASLPS